MKTFDDRMHLVRISGRRPWWPAKGGRTNITLPDENDPAPKARMQLAIRRLLCESVVTLTAYFTLIIVRNKCWPMAFMTWYGPIESLVIGMTPGLIFIWLWRRTLRRMNVPPASLSDFCAACIHPLTGVPADHDGCVVCPECGAAWRVRPRDDQSSNASR